MNDALVGTTTTPPFLFSVDTHEWQDGNHVMTAVAEKPGGATTEVSVPITIRNTPELVVSNIEVPEFIPVNTPFEASVTLHSVGAPFENADLKLLGYIDGVEHTSDDEISMKRGEKRTVRFEVPAVQTIGRHSLVIFAGLDNIEGLDQSNNAFHIDFYSLSPPPDPAIQEVRIVPKQPRQGDTVHIEVALQNLGPGILEGDLPIEVHFAGKRRFPLLENIRMEPGEVQIWTIERIVPYDIQLLSVTVSLGGEESLYDANLSNNIGKEDVFILPPPPDLIVSDLHVNTHPIIEGRDFTASATIVNVGDGPVSAAVQAGYSIDKLPPEFSTQEISLQPGQDYQWSFSLRGIKQVGLHTLEITIDPGHQISEINDLNNTRNIVIDVTPLPDLVIQGVEIPSDPIFPGDLFDLKVTLANIGQAHFWGAVTVKGYINETTELFSHEETIYDIPYMDEYPLWIKVTAPAQPERLVTTIIVDPQETIDELNKDNNKDLFEFDIQEPPHADPEEKTAQLESGLATVDHKGAVIHLEQTYRSPVVVATVRRAHNDIPIVTRISDVEASQFRLRLVNPSGLPVLPEEVTYLVVEEGAWEIDGMRIEAQKYMSTVTDSSLSWIGERQTFLQEYEQPVVIGQVMSKYNEQWSVFWSRGFTKAQAASRKHLYTGKTVCEDPEREREPEVIGFVVIEEGSGMLGATEWEASTGTKHIRGQGVPIHRYPFQYEFQTAPKHVIASLAGQVGGDGGWVQVEGDGATTAGLPLSVQEDQLKDTERWHTAERASYVAFDGPVLYP